MWVPSRQSRNENKKKRRMNKWRQHRIRISRMRTPSVYVFISMLSSHNGTRARYPTDYGHQIKIEVCEVCVCLCAPVCWVCVHVWCGCLCVEGFVWYFKIGPDMAKVLFTLVLFFTRISRSHSARPFPNAPSTSIILDFLLYILFLLVLLCSCRMSNWHLKHYLVQE